MISVTQEQIKEIADQLDCGFRCFVHKQNGETLFIPDELRLMDIEMDAWAEEQEKLDNNYSDYAEIEPLESWNSFQIMGDFVETLDDSNPLKENLLSALNRRKPFGQFKSVIDNSGEYRQRWFDFKNRELNRWVHNAIDRINGLEG